MPDEKEVPVIYASDNIPDKYKEPCGFYVDFRGREPLVVHANANLRRDCKGLEAEFYAIALQYQKKYRDLYKQIHGREPQE